MKCAVIGGGVIGAGWAARLLLNGHDVAVFDPAPSAERAVGEMLANAERAYARMTLAPLGNPGTLRFAASIAEAVSGAGFIQESAPERVDLKQAILNEIDAHAAPDALICSSTSGLLPTELQSGMRHPERFTVGHPFNPVYLLPLVELCGGAKTAPETIERARAFYAGIGMKPLHVRKEIDGFIADRLLEALWREALWLVNDGVATTEEIDDAIRYGAGLRWSFMGTFLIYRLAGGEAGMRHFMAQFGPALKLPWTKLMDVPELTEALIDEVTAQSDAQAGGLTHRELERKRDDCLVAVMQALKSQEFGAGAVLAAYEAGLYRSGHSSAVLPEDLAQPLRLHHGLVREDWVDYNKHMTESRYLQVCTNATDALLKLVGVDLDYVAAGHSYFTAETHILHRKEIPGLDPYYTTTLVLGADDKRVHLFHEIRHGRTDALLASGEHMLLHVDMKAGKAVPAPPEIAARFARIRAAHAGLPRPDAAGRAISSQKPRGVAGPAVPRMIDAEVAAFIARTESFYPASTNAAGPAENRAVYNRMCDAFRAPRPAGCTVMDLMVEAEAPARELPVRHYIMDGVTSDVTLLYLHGGGYVVGGLDSHDDVCAELARDAGIEVVSLDYRLSPEHAYPAALDDVEAAYRHLAGMGRRVIVGGDSAGGNLAAALCLRLKRLGAAQPVGQVLIYPGLGGDPFRNGERNLDAPLLPVRHSGGYRALYAGGEDRIPKDDAEFAPLSARDATGLAPAAIIAAGIDPLRQDAEDYAALLAASGVSVLFRSEPGLVHGYLRARHASRAVARSFAAIGEALRQMADGRFAGLYDHPLPEAH
jgi:carnitine 3-dehydrogenase